MLLIRTKSGAELRIPIDDVESIDEIEPVSGDAKPIPSHPYLHREGVNRCAACWQARLHPSHTDIDVRA